MELESIIASRLRRNPMDGAALCAEISFQEELEAGVRESVVAHKWLQKLAGAA
jgi:hypothetical protein